MDVVTLVVLGTVVVSWQFMERRDKSKWMLVPLPLLHSQGVAPGGHPCFVHADWMHLAFNMFVLYEFGRVVNGELAGLGWMGFPALYVVGIVAGAIPALQKHKHNPSYASLGASGAVSAVLLAFIVLASHAHVVAVFCHSDSGGAGRGALLLVRKPNATTRSYTHCSRCSPWRRTRRVWLWVVLFVPSAVPRFIAALQGLLP